MSAVSIAGLGKAFGGRPVLDRIDLQVPNAQVTAVLGPSGCGKTTLLRIVAGFLAPDSGTVAFGGQVVAGAGAAVPPQQRQVGYVPQEGALFPHLSVRDNILFGLPRRERTSQRLTELLELTGLPSRLGPAHPHQLSGGQQQRVALARALAPRPRVVLLDEPFSSLDAALRESTGRAVSRMLRASGTTALLVTHDQGEALSLADQVAVMRAGRLAQVASPVDLYRTPGDVDIATFVGGASVLPARIQDGRGSCLLGEVSLQSPALVSGDARVVIRPEQIVLGAPEGAPVRAVVDEVHFYGHDATVRLRLEDTDRRLVARVTTDQVPEVGARVGLRVAGQVRAYR